MRIEMLKCKIHRARITAADLHYEGSLSLDENLMDAAGLVPFEKIQVVNLNNGERLETYVITGERGSGVLQLNGAAARRGQPGDIVILIGYCSLDEEEVRTHKPVLVYVDESNRILPSAGARV